MESSPLSSISPATGLFSASPFTPERPNRVAVLGASGSIGTAALEVIAASGGRLKTALLSVRRNTAALAEAANRFRPETVVIADSDADSGPLSNLPDGVEVLFGAEALEKAVVSERIDTVLAAIVGAAGLRSALAAVQAGKTLALANKEALVMAGPLLMETARKSGARVIPVDSEHSAIYQALASRSPVEYGLSATDGSGRRTEEERAEQCPRWLTAVGNGLSATNGSGQRTEEERAEQCPRWLTANGSGQRTEEERAEQCPRWLTANGSGRRTEEERAEQCPRWLTASVRRLILTASGGPFRNRPLAEMDRVTVAETLAHPTWKMGKKITVDSATMMNKAFEIIEARWLFDVPADRIAVVIHPQSIIHSMVEFIDGAVIAQLSPPDMKLPIQLALYRANRVEGPASKFDWTQSLTLELSPPDEERFPALRLGREAAASGGTAGTVISAANETAVEAFLAGKIPLTKIVAACRAMLEYHTFEARPTVERLIELDARTRGETIKWISQ